MLRRFNATERQRIDREDALVRILPFTPEDEGARKFELELDLTIYGFPTDAQVRVEAWRSNIVERWEFGSVGQPAPGTLFTQPMQTAPVTSQFKVKVVAGDGSGKLLGASADIRPKLPTESLIPLIPQDLGDEVWRVDFGDDSDLPELAVNCKIEAISEIVRNDAAFRALVMPQVLRTVLTQIIFVEGGDDDDTDEQWYSGWFRLAKSIAPGEVPKLSDRDDSGQQADARKWIERVVAEFAAKRVDAAQQYRTAQGAAS